MHVLVPMCLCELVVSYVPRRVLGSAELNILTDPPGNLVNMDAGVLLEPQRIYGTLRVDRATWLMNSPTLENFKTHLNTYLFWERFSS